MIAPERSLTRHLLGETLANAQRHDHKATLNPLQFYLVLGTMWLPKHSAAAFFIFGHCCAVSRPRTFILNALMAAFGGKADMAYCTFAFDPKRTLITMLRRFAASFQ